MSSPCPSEETQQATLDSVVARVAQAIEHQLSTGDVAELRRISPEEPYTPALWKLLLAHVPESWTGGAQRDEKERRWAALFMGMALTTGLHNPGLPLGRALVAAGWSELRFVQLMRDRGTGLVERVRRLAHYLAGKSQQANWADIAQLLFNQEGEWAERHRRHIARDYYRALFNREQTNDQ